MKINLNSIFDTGQTSERVPVISSIKGRVIRAEPLERTSAFCRLTMDENGMNSEYQVKKASDFFSPYIGTIVEIVCRFIITGYMEIISIRDIAIEAIYSASCSDFGVNAEELRNDYEKLSADRKEVLRKAMYNTEALTDNDWTTLGSFDTIEEMRLKAILLKHLYPENITEKIQKDFRRVNRSQTRIQTHVDQEALSYLLSYPYAKRPSATTIPLAEVKAHLDGSIPGQTHAKEALIKAHTELLDCPLHHKDKTYVLLGSEGDGRQELIEAWAAATKRKTEYLDGHSLDRVTLYGSSRGYDNSYVGDFHNKLHSLGRDGVLVIRGIETDDGTMPMEDFTGILAGIIAARRYYNQHLEVKTEIYCPIVVLADSKSNLPQVLIDSPNVEVISAYDYTEDELLFIGRRCYEKLFTGSDRMVEIDDDALRALSSRYIRKNNIKDVSANISEVFTYAASHISEDGHIEVTINNLRDFFSLLKRKKEIWEDSSGMINSVNDKLKLFSYSDCIRRSIENYISCCKRPYDLNKAYYKDALKMLSDLHFDEPGARTSKDVPAKIVCLDSFFLDVDRLLSYRTCRPVLLVGGAGGGKTSFARAYAQRKGLAFAYFNANEQSYPNGICRIKAGIAASIAKAKAIDNILLLIDELDEAADYSAYYTLLDSGRNTFFDDFTQTEIPKHGITIIATANDIDRIPEPILDRMRVLKMPSYTQQQKKQILSQAVIPRLLEEYGYKGDPSELFSDEIIDYIVDHYSHGFMGIRELEKTVETLIPCFANIRKQKGGTNECSPRDSSNKKTPFLLM